MASSRRFVRTNLSDLSIQCTSYNRSRPTGSEYLNFFIYLFFFKNVFSRYLYDRVIKVIHLFPPYLSSPLRRVTGHRRERCFSATSRLAQFHLSFLVNSLPPQCALILLLRRRLRCRHLCCLSLRNQLRTHYPRRRVHSSALTFNRMFHLPLQF